MGFFYTELIIKNSPFSLTTSRLYDELNDNLDNGILFIIENIERTPRGRRKTFVVCATCRSYNPFFKHADHGDHITICMNLNGKKQRLRLNVTLPDHS
jgi:hypothetical protein